MSLWELKSAHTFSKGWNVKTLHWYGWCTYVKVGLADWLMRERRSFTLRRTDMLCYLVTSVVEYIAICLGTVQRVENKESKGAWCGIVVLCIVVLYCRDPVDIVIYGFGIVFVVISVVLPWYCCIVRRIGCLCSVVLWSRAWYRVAWYCRIIFEYLCYYSIVRRIESVFYCFTVL